MEYGVYGDFITIYPKPHSIYLRGTIGFRHRVEIYRVSGMGYGVKGPTQHRLHCIGFRG